MPAEVLGHQPYITCHLAWEPTPPTRSLGKARPTLREGVRTGGGVGTVQPFPRQILGVQPCPTQKFSTPIHWEGWDAHWPIL